MRGKNLLISLTLAVGFLTLLMVAFRPPASARTSFTVNSTADAVDATPGDGVCETESGNDLCTLRAAIMETNTLPGAHVIILPAGSYTLTIPGQDDDAAVGDLDINKELEIQGAGVDEVVVEQSVSDRVFDVMAPVGQAVTLAGFTIRGGSTPDRGGGVCNCTAESTLILMSMIITDNFAHSGGAVASFGMLMVDESLMAGNVSRAGSGIYNSSQVGQGIAVVTNSRIVDNTAYADGTGGGISNDGIMTVTHTTLSGNSAVQMSFGALGGAIANWVDGTMVLINSTLSQNSADSNGGAVFNRGVISVTNTTMAGNVAPQGSGIRNLEGTVELKNVILANDPATNCTASDPPVTSNGHNLDSGNSCGFSEPGDLINTDPLLGPLQNNGGPTETHALLAGSPAIDAGDDVGCPATDQRGVIRPIDGDGDGTATCDMGAFEYDPNEPTPTPTFTPTVTPTPTFTPTFTPTPTPTFTPTFTPTPSITPSATPTSTSTPTATLSPTATPTTVPPQNKRHLPVILRP